MWGSLADKCGNQFHMIFQEVLKKKIEKQKKIKIILVLLMQSFSYFQEKKKKKTDKQFRKAKILQYQNQDWDGDIS